MHLKMSFPSGEKMLKFPSKHVMIDFLQQSLGTVWRVVYNFRLSTKLEPMTPLCWPRLWIQTGKWVGKKCCSTAGSVLLEKALNLVFFSVTVCSVPDPSGSSPRLAVDLAIATPALSRSLPPSHSLSLPLCPRPLLSSPLLRHPFTPRPSLYSRFLTAMLNEFRRQGNPDVDENPN